MKKNGMKCINVYYFRQSDYMKPFNRTEKKQELQFNAINKFSGNVFKFEYSLGVV